MNIIILLFIVFLIISNGTLKINANKSPDSQKISDTENKDALLTAALYSKMFKERRKEQQYMVKQMVKSTYAKNFKLLKLAYAKIFEVIRENNATLFTYNYRSGFPTDASLQEAVILTLESCCIASESVLHFPEISYRIFSKTNKFSNWKPVLNWCVTFVNALPHLIDESTVKLMELMQQEINEELRNENYANPYYKQQPLSEDLVTSKPQRKLPKKLKKGPQLSGTSRNEL